MANSQTDKIAHLGVECGATRSVALLALAGGARVLRAEFGPGNLRLLSDAALVKHFRAIKMWQGKSAAKLTGVGIGMAGVRTEPDRKRVLAAVAKIWGKTPCCVTDDLETALAAADLNDKYKSAARVLILSGTGSCCYGRRRDGATARFGGWGHILGDKGSGYEIGLRGLKASVHFLDRHGRWPLLGRNILRALHLNAPEDLIDWAKVAAKSEIAALAVEVFESAREGDKTARDILDGAVASLAKDGVHCAQRLVKPGAPVEFIFAGSVLLKQPAFAKRVKRRLLELWPGARTGNLQREGAYGALALAVGKPSLNKTVETSSIYGPSSLRMSPTEERNPRSRNLDRLPLLNAVALMIQEEAKVSRALLKEKQNIARVVEWVAGALRRGGRLFYVGAGTSGRLGILDAAECPPTFRALPEQVQGIIAGGQSAIWKSIEGAEDNAEAGASAIEWRGVNRRDVVIGIAASGRTPFVWGAFDAARRKGAKTVLICFNPYLEIRPGNRPDLVIAPVVGPEVLTGSTRLKAGTATKVILNTITTLAMTRLGKVAGNLMVDLNASNKKLRDRAVRIVQEVTGADAMTARGALEKSKWIVKTACQRLR